MVIDKLTIDGKKFNSKREMHQFLKEKYGYPVNFPESLLEKAINLNEVYSEGYDELAWKDKDIIKVIEFLAEQGFVILGGYAYLFENNEIEFRGDNWTFKPNNEDKKIVIHNGVRYVTYDFNYDNPMKGNK